MDADDIQMVRDAADRLFGDLCNRRTIAAAEAGEWPASLWDATVHAGLTVAAVSEERGGAGMPITDALSIASIAAEYAAPIPLGETIVAAWLLDRAGIDVPDGPLTFAEDRGGVALRVAWGHVATRVVIGDALRVHAPGPAEPGRNMAGEPRDTVALADATLLASAPAPVTLAEMRLLGAALRAVQIAGALRRAARLATSYAQDRIQFGRSLSKFQAIQQSLAVLATQASVATAAAEMAARAVGDDRMMPTVAVAKARCGEAAGVGAAIAHQVHGAIGFTLEHDLQLVTRRLLSWRDEFGNETEWNAAVGRQLLASPADDLWHRVTEI